MRRYFPLISSIVSLAMIVLMLQAYMTQPSSAQSDVSNYDNIRASGYMRAGTDITADDDLLVGGHMGMTPQAAIVVGYQGTITPTGGLQYLTSTASRGTRLVVTTTVTAGTHQEFYNSGNFTITLTDTAPLVLSGNLVLGPKDTAILFSNGTEWVQLDEQNN